MIGTAEQLAEAYCRVLAHGPKPTQPIRIPRPRVERITVHKKPGRKPVSAEARADGYRARYADVIAAYQSGKSTVEIGRERGVTHQFIHLILKYAQIQTRARRGRQHRCEHSRCGEIAVLLTENLSPGDMAVRLGMLRANVESVVSFHHWGTRGNRHRCHGTLCEDSIRWYAEGVGTPEIGRRLGGRGNTTVQKWLRAHGVALRPRGYMKGGHCPRYHRRLSQ